MFYRGKDEKMEKEYRDKYWDIMKGLGIIAVVLGHSGCPYPFVVIGLNYYHMALFFFCSWFFL